MCVFLDRRGLTGQRGFLCLKTRGIDQPGVGRDSVAGFKNNEIAGDQLASWNRLEAPLPDDTRHRHRHLAQGCQRSLGAKLLDKPKHTVEKDDGHDGRRVEPIV